MKKKTSILWKIPKDEIEMIVKNHYSFSQILKYFGLSNKGGNTKTLKKRLIEENIDFSHISLGCNSNLGRKFPKEKIPLEAIMVKNSTYSRSHLKDRLLSDGILENKCSICGQAPIHNNIKLIMVLDHINGISDDHTKENLRLLCPNCNSQQSTFAGRKNKKTYICNICGKERKNKNSKYCFDCSVKINGYKKRIVKDRPPMEQLLNEIKELGYSCVGRKYGVSGNAIKKWVVKYG